MGKQFGCSICGKRFGSNHAAKQHRADKHGRIADHPDCGKEGAKAVLESIGLEDLPDGAFLTLADDLGLDPDTLTKGRQGC